MKPLLCVAVCVSALLSLCGCRTASATAERRDTYEYTAQVLAMPSCRATMVKDHTCVAEFKAQDGRTFYIGSPGASPEIAGFLGTLEEGKAYDLPDAFMEYQSQQQKKARGKADDGGGK